MAKEKHRGDAASAEKWWVIHQHDELTVVKAGDRPSSEVEKGERMKEAWGPYRTQEEAQQRADKIYSRTLKGMQEKAGMI